MLFTLVIVRVMVLGLERDQIDLAMAHAALGQQRPGEAADLASPDP
jgi:hypothetical protein